MGDGKPNPLLEVRNLSVVQGRGDAAKALTHDVAFTIGVSNTVALVGESGSGKTVSAMSILGLLPQGLTAHGKILYEGHDLLTAGPARLRHVRGRDIGVIFQEPMTALNPVYTIGRLLQQVLTSHDDPRHRRKGQEIRSRSLELLDIVGLPDPDRRLQMYPHQLSGGQRQRAMIAMAIAHRPRLLIADEPTTALDVTAQAGILDLLTELRDEWGMSLLLVSHDMGVVAEMADSVVVMNEGRVVEDRPVVELFRAPEHDYTRRLLAAVPRLGTVTSPVTEPIPMNRSEEEGSPLLRVDSLVVSFPGRFRRPPVAAVDDVSFTVAADEFVGLVGESGSGKSTIARVAMGLIPPTQGRVDVGDVALLARRNGRRANADSQRLHRTAAMVFQDPASSLNPRLSIGESIQAPLRWNRIEKDRRVREARVRDLLDQVRIPSSWSTRLPHELSGGQRQRVAIARALALRPQLLIADEPTSALDVSVQESILRLLLELKARLGFACLFISHDLSVVEQLSDRMVVLRRGKIAEQGTTSAVLRHPTDPYTVSLIAAVPIPDPQIQRGRGVDRRAARISGEEGEARSVGDVPSSV